MPYRANENTSTPNRIDGPLEADETYQIGGRELSTARRAVAVALLIRAISGGVETVRELLPSDAEMARVLDMLDRCETRDGPVPLGPEDRAVLELVVYAALILAIQEGERNAFVALQSASGADDVDVAALSALESLAALAFWLKVPERRRHEDATTDPNLWIGEMLISPALSALADAIALPVWICDADLAFEWVNLAFAAILGTDAQAVRGTSWRHWCAPADSLRVGQLIEEARDDQRNFTIEAGAGPPGGPFVRLLMIVAPRQCPAGSLLGWTGICFDVTADAQLWTRMEPVTRPVVADTARTHLLLDQLPGVLWTTDLGLICTSCLGAGLRTLGLAPNALVGMPVAQIVGSSDERAPAVRAQMAAVGGESARYRDTAMGREWETYVEPLRDARGHIVGCIGLSLDITDSLAREHNRQRLMRQLEFAQAVGRMGSWELEIGTGQWLWSDEAYRLLGTEPGGVAPSLEAFLDRVHPDDRERLRERHEEALRSGEGFEMAYRLVGFDGRVRQMRGVVRFEHGADGTLVRLAGIFQDVGPTAAAEGDAL